MRIPIADIKRLTIHDGPGTRTTVFVKGCPLRCRWCHNPECWSADTQLLFHQKLCVGCRQCETACPHQAIHFDASTGARSFDAAKCQTCGACQDVCTQGALSLCGREMTVDEVRNAVLLDRSFYGEDGGVTLSGGEPILYPAFVKELFRRLQHDGIHTALDTCGVAPFESYEQVLPYTDLILFDIKGYDADRHRANTGRDNGLILYNLLKISNRFAGIPIEVRIPIIPGLNDSPDEIRQIKKFLERASSVRSVKLLPFHHAREKYHACGFPYLLSDDQREPTEEELASLREA